MRSLEIRGRSSLSNGQTSSDLPGGDTEEFLPTRLSLLSRIKDSKDQDAWNEFFQTYWRLIYQTALRTGMGDANAEDIVQETMASVIKELQACKYDATKGSFKSWLLNCTRWRIKDHFRKEQERLRIEGRKDVGPRTSKQTSTVDRQPDPAGVELEKVWDEEWENAIRMGAIECARRVCDPKDFQIFHYHVIRQNPVSKVAKTFHLSRGRIYLARLRVRRVIANQLKKLREQMI